MSALVRIGIERNKQVMKRFLEMIQCKPYFVDFCLSVIIVFVFVGFGFIGWYMGWVNHVRFGYTLSNEPKDDIVALGRVSSLFGVIGVIYIIPALMQFYYLLQKTKK